MWVKPWLSKRLKIAIFSSILAEMKLEDKEALSYFSQVYYNSTQVFTIKNLKNVPFSAKIPNKPSYCGINLVVKFKFVENFKQKY